MSCRRADLIGHTMFSGKDANKVFMRLVLIRSCSLNGNVKAVTGHCFISRLKYKSDF